MLRAFVLLCALLGGCATLPSAPSLAGTWRLDSYVDTPEGGAPVMAFGEHPIGYFVFTADGRASVSIMRNPPSSENAPADPDPDSCLPDWYCSYFGTYRVDWARSEWTVHVEGANIPSFIGSDQTRAFAIQGDKIVISGSYEDGVRTVRYRRELTRIP